MTTLTASGYKHDGAYRLLKLLNFKVVAIGIEILYEVFGVHHVERSNKNQLNEPLNLKKKL